MKNQTYLAPRFNYRIALAIFSLALFCFGSFNAQEASADKPTVSFQKKSGGSKGASSSNRGRSGHSSGSHHGSGSRQSHSGHSHGSRSHSGRSHSGHSHSGRSHSGGSHSGHSSSGRPYSHSYNKSSNHSHTGNSHGYYRNYNSNFRSTPSSYRSYHSNYRNYPSRSYLSVSPYGLSFGYGGIGVSSYYRPTTSYYSYRPALPYGYSGAYPGYRSSYGSYSNYGTYQPYAIPNNGIPLNYSTPYFSRNVPYGSPVLTPAESSTTSELLDGGVVGQSTLGQTQVPTNEAAREVQQQAEQGFRQGDYAGAKDLARQAGELDPDNGQLMLFESQANFAIGEFSKSAELVLSATKLLPQDQWGLVVNRFRDFYGRNDYVSQTDRLSQLISQQPGDAQALALRGYHYGALGYPDAATKDFQRALEIDPENELAQRLLPVMGSVAPSAAPAEVQVPTPADGIPLDGPES